MIGGVFNSEVRGSRRYLRKREKIRLVWAGRKEDQDWAGGVKRIRSSIYIKG